MLALVGRTPGGSLLTALLCCAASGCGGSAASPPNSDATLLLDFTPNAVHAGVYSTVVRGFDTAEGVTLHVREPGSSTDSVKLLASGRTEFAILDIHDLALARARGEDLVGVMAIVEQPLAALEAQPAIRNPRQLMGRAVGVSGLPSDNAVLRSVVAGAGGNPSRVRRVTIGFNAVPALLAGRVAAVTAFWDVEGLQLHARSPAIHEFRLERFGAPAYPELVLCVSARTLREQPSLVGATVAALRRGYAVTLSDPQSSVEDELSRVPGLDAGTLRAQLDALGPAFAGSEPAFGTLDRSALRAWATWEARFGVVPRSPDVGAMFDARYANAPPPPDA
ncbi:MAG: hypothetical protein DLM63_04890 [Solirubrobacterales bacterium]|nr:MAG: hypothetical protein DLM63_04890 [Solirubrobacterales bacterium]